MKLLLLMCLFLPFNAKTQVGPIELSDLTGFHQLNLVALDSIHYLDTSFVFQVHFKIDEYEESDSIFVKIGAFEGDNSTYSEAWSIKRETGFYLYNSSSTIDMYNGNIYLDFSLSKSDYLKYRFIEVFGKEPDGTLSNLKKVVIYL